MTDRKCICVTRHSPANPPLERHHSPPTSYPLKPGSTRMLIDLCASAHGIQHRLLNLLRTNPSASQSRYSQFHRDVAVHTRNNTDLSQPLPRTSPHE